MRYLDPKNDLTFKRIFGEHPHLLKSFLNAVMPLPENTQIVSLEYLSAELVPEIPVFKNSIVDVRCKDNFGRQFIVEMQMLWTDSFKSRVLFNASKAFVKQVDRGVDYKGLQPVYSLNIINEDFDKSEAYLHHYKIVHTQDSNKLMKGLEFVFVELPKFKAMNFTDKKLQILWLRFLSELHDNDETIPQEFLDNPEIKEAIDLMRISGFTREELETYDRYWDYISTEKTLIVDSLDKGKIEGKIEEKFEIAVAILKNGLGIELTATITGLSIDEVTAIAQGLGF